MSAGCAIVASDTQPLREAILDGKTGVLVNFFDHGELVKKACHLLDHPEERSQLGHNARAFAIQNFDLKTVCLPRQIDWVEALVLS